MGRRSGEILGGKMMDKHKMRRKNILYKLRRKGVRCDTRGRTIFFPYNGSPFDVVQVRRLCKEYNFKVQLEII